MAGTHSYWLGALLLVGCGFEAAPGEDEVMTEDPTPPIVDPALERKCATTDDSLRLCIDFEDSVLDATDGSGRNHHPILVAGLTTNVRDTELAAEMGMASKLQIKKHTDLDITTNLTVSMWVNTTTRPATGSSYWLLDNNNQYSMSIQPNGAIRCGLGASTVDSAANVNIGGSGWHQVACTYDGSRLKVYIDGWVAGCRSVDRPIATTGNEGLSIGSNLGAGPVFNDKFVGGLDNVQVFARTFSDSELCAESGGGWCNSSCTLAGANGGDDDESD